MENTLVVNDNIYKKIGSLIIYNQEGKIKVGTFVGIHFNRPYSAMFCATIDGKVDLIDPIDVESIDDRNIKSIVVIDPENTPNSYSEYFLD